MLPIYILIGVVVLIVLWAFAAYNGLIRLRNEAENSWAQIDVQLKRRHDLIPNLVETAKGYMKHERETLENVTKARNLAVGVKGIGETGKVESALSGALANLFAVAENYPDLKANQNFLALQEELTSTENKIAFSRQYYNDTVMRFNTRIETVPTNIIANMGHFTKKEFFVLEDKAQREAPKVSF
ncbi:MAG: hypothetical protein A2Z34_01855 [Planctomycetes bacterium RBG_16_59_8]|nr:MAG: hypothetical protein A2Z34_01855 [Planctomycetes bacterium RBG_16_59_8]